MKIAIIGYGNMGKTYAKSFIHSKFIKATDILIFSRSSINNQEMYGIPDINFSNTISREIETADIVIIAVKPQDFLTLGSQIKDFLSEKQIILSVMAGVTISRIENVLKISKIVRSMPNLATQIGMGLTVFSASKYIDRKELFIVQNLINTTGKSVYVENESLLNVSTAVSGSGPAYVFYFMNSMVKVAQELGFTASEAELLVNQTFLGAVSLQMGSAISNQEWINKVTSKGGTTQKALEIFEENNLDSIINHAVKGANKRAIELGK